MGEKKTRAEMVIELDTQEALNRISELRVDLQLPESQCLLAEKPSISRQNLERFNFIKRGTKQFSSNRQEKAAPAPTLSPKPQIKKTPIKEVSDSRESRRATVKVNGIEAHVTATSLR